MSVLRCFLPRVLLIGLFLSVAIFPLVEQAAGTAADPLSPEERAFVAAHGPIRYAPDPLFPPFEYLDSSGVARGITPDLLIIMGKKLGVEFRGVAYPSWSGVLEAAKLGKVDLLGTLTRTPEREGFLLFSKPYLSVPYVLFVRQDGSDPKTIEDMVSGRLGVVRDYGINTWLSAAHPNIRPVVVEDTVMGLTMVSTGQLDALLETLPVGAYLVRQYSLTNIRIVERHIYTLSQHFGVLKEEPLLLSIVQKGLDSLTEAERSEVFVRWTGQDFTRPPLAISPLVLNTLLILIAAAVLSVAWILALRRSVRRATLSLRKSEVRYQDLYENANDIIYTHDLEGNFTSINKAAERVTGYTLDESLKMKIDSVLAPEYVEVARKMLSQKVQEGGQTRFELEIVCKNDRRIPLEVSTRIIYEGGKPVGIQGIARDITERKQAEEALKAQLAFREGVVECAADGICVCNATPDYPYISFTIWNNRMTEITGYSMDEINRLGWYQSVYPDPDVQARARDRMDRMRQGDNLKSEEWEITRSDGAKRFVTISTSVLYARDKTVDVLAVIHDITDRKREEEEKGKMQAQLQQAMKMEAVGRLAGGVAHDFNNLLTAIIGNVSLALMKLSSSDPVAGLLGEANKGAERAASLTQQLLAFSRKQIIEPKITDLNELVAGLHTMLARLIGEIIELKTVPGIDLGMVKVDPGQFEQILVNLAVNARDAMPEGGKLLIETANVDLDEEYCSRFPYVRPGRFVMLAVSDTGHGMSEEVMKQIFEPFFTTKPKGTGTGLGLATIYGVVKQSDGSIEVESKVGKGTTFKIYLPRVEGEAASPQESNLPMELLTGSETVLLVEDEEIVRNMCVQVLERLGYSVMQASNGDEAIALAMGYGKRIDLLMTDVVMPGMHGRELADQLTRMHPEARVLFTSGYTDNAIVHHGVLEEGVSFIGKPYSLSALAKKVRDVLDKA